MSIRMVTRLINVRITRQVPTRNDLWAHVVVKILRIYQPLTAIIRCTKAVSLDVAQHVIWSDHLLCPDRVPRALLLEVIIYGQIGV